MRPHYRIGDRRFFVDVHAGAENGIRDLRTGFYNASLADHRGTVDTCRGRDVIDCILRIEEVTDLSAQEIQMCREIALGRSDVAPVRRAQYVPIERSIIFDQQRENVVFE